MSLHSSTDQRSPEKQRDQKEWVSTRAPAEQRRGAFLGGLGTSGLEVRTRLFTHGGVAECLYNSLWEPTEIMRCNLRAKLGLG